MLDIELIRQKPEFVAEGVAAKKGDRHAVYAILDLDTKRRHLVTKVEELRQRRNEISKQIPILAKEKQPIDALKEESRTIGDSISAFDHELAKLEADLQSHLLTLPNLPNDRTPVGDTESANVVMRTWGEPRSFSFTPKPHWELGEALGILELARGAKLSGSGFYALKGLGAKLERNLISWMIDTHVRLNGYTEIAPPFLVSRETITGTGQLPKFEDDLFKTKDEDLFLIPTAEVPVTNLHADEILEAAELPIRYCAYTPCFRRESGGYGKETRGISRVHQFSKVEMVMFEKPENSYAVHDELVRHATWFLEQIGIPYRVVALCTGDLGFGAALCHDIEIWAPGMNTWLEISSCSNFEAFQARRAKMRYRPEPGARPEFIHTLNGSGLALPRLWIAILENFQQEDGSIALPPVLQDVLGVKELRA